MSEGVDETPSTVEQASASTSTAISTTVSPAVEEPLFESPPDSCPEPEQKYRPGNVVVEEVLGAGNLAGPTIVLTPRPALGALWTGDFAVTTLADADQDSEIRLAVGWTSVVSECAEGVEGGWQATRTTERAELDIGSDVEMFPIPVESANDLLGFTFVTDYKDYGSWLLEETPEFRQLNDDSYQLYLELERNFKFVAPTMPSQIVGIGATWTYSFDKEIARGSGIDMHFEVLDINDTTYELSFEIDGDAGLAGAGHIVGDITQQLPTEFFASYTVAAVPGVTVHVELSQAG